MDDSNCKTRLNLPPKTFKAFLKEGKRILQEYERIQKECSLATAKVRPYMALVQEAGGVTNMGIAVIRVGDKPEVHVGTPRYVKAMFELGRGNSHPTPPYSSGHLIPVGLFTDLIHGGLAKMILHDMGLRDDICDRDTWFDIRNLDRWCYNYLE